jgi:mono/diheme cytochrome c family protein
VILALSGGQKLGLIIVAAIFIGFALASSFVFPRTNPDFPGRRLPLFVLVVIGLLVAMLTAMVVLARESEEEHSAGESQPAQTEPAPGTTQSESQPSGGEKGDPAAGKQVFESAGCKSCHTLADAGATGTVGPNLDEAKPSYDLVVERVTNGKPPMPSFKGQLTEKQIQDVAAYVSSIAGKS